MIPFGGWGSNVGGVNPSLDVNNTIYTRQISAGFDGPTIGLIADGAYMPTAEGNAGTMIASDQSGFGGNGAAAGPNALASWGTPGGAAPKHIVGWLIALMVLLVGLMYFAKRYGTEGESFSNIKLSLYNIFVISLAYIIGGNLLKALFARFQVPGISQLILAA